MPKAIVKVSKNITLTLGNVEIIMQMMDKTKRNFSFTVNYILEDWVKVRKYLYQKTNLTKEEETQFKEIEKAKVIKE